MRTYEPLVSGGACAGRPPTAGACPCSCRVSPGGGIPPMLEVVLLRRLEERA
ncbi:MAG: hypothetical protein IPH72_30315 [Sandaracinaceae bacterium]|nr:hypothetical protein [Sandaracinaceae bacterium]